MQKYQLKKERLNFTQDWITTEEEMVEDHPDCDLLNALLQGNSHDMDEAAKFVNHYEAKDLEE